MHAPPFGRVAAPPRACESRAVDRPATISSGDEARRRLSDALARVAGGSESALQEVYRSTSAKLFGLILRILGDRGEAEDALQEVYVSVWRRAGSFDAGRASPVTWLAAIARNRAIDRLRASGRPRPSEPIEAARDVADGGADALAQLEAGEDRARLVGCVDELEARQASAIRSAFFGGLSYPELAEGAGVPLGTMKSWIRRGLLRLRDCLDR
jgi:RNA polymerase sigma-70 factor (ECF subfamily)